MLCPYLPVPGNAAEERPTRDVRNPQPIKDCLPHPRWKADVPRLGAFPLEAYEAPLPITLLNVLYVELHELSSRRAVAKSTARIA